MSFYESEKQSIIKGHEATLERLRKRIPVLEFAEAIAPLFAPVADSLLERPQSRIGNSMGGGLARNSVQVQCDMAKDQSFMALEPILAVMESAEGYEFVEQNDFAEMNNRNWVYRHIETKTLLEIRAWLPYGGTEFCKIIEKEVLSTESSIECAGEAA